VTARYIKHDAYWFYFVKTSLLDINSSRDWKLLQNTETSMSRNDISTQNCFPAISANFSNTLTLPDDRHPLQFKRWRWCHNVTKIELITTANWFNNWQRYLSQGPTPVAARTKAWVCSCSHTGIAGSNPAEGMDGCLSFVSVVWCQVEVSASGWSLVQKESYRVLCVWVCSWSLNAEEALAH